MHFSQISLYCWIGSPYLSHHLTIQSCSRSEISLYVLANIVGHTVASLKHALSKLQSILTFTPKREKFWRELFPRSVHIFFYYTSFIKFLLNKTRSGEYWLENWHYYTVLATKVLCLFKDLYVMNGILWGISFFPSDISCCE